MTSAAPDGSETGWGDVVGQPEALARLRAAAAEPVHAYLFVGPHGCGKRAAARAFAGEILARAAGAKDGLRHRALAAAETHPDLIVVERKGARIDAAQADDIVRRASRSPVESDRQVLVLDEFHLIDPSVGGKLLKTIEEPPTGTYFLVLAEEVLPDLVTIASRCVRIDFGPVPTEVIAARLTGEGVERGAAAEVALAAYGDLRRARLLATDEGLASRLAAWRQVPDRLDGTGATAAALVDELRAGIDAAQRPLTARQEREQAELEQRIDQYGQRGSGAGIVRERHARERRRLRADELRLGLAELSRRYRDALTAGSARSDPSLDALGLLQGSAEALDHNPNEELLLVALLVRLPTLTRSPAGPGNP